MDLTNDQNKIDLISRLVKDGAIDFKEAILLLETEKAYVNIPANVPNPYPGLPPWDINPYRPIWQIFPDNIQYCAT